MASKIRIPAYYKAPLKTREEITNYLFGDPPAGKHASRFYDQTKYLICFNVKIHSSVDASFENMLARSEVDKDRTNDPYWMAKARAAFEKDFKEDRASDSAIENMRDMTVDSDCYRMFWSGESVKVKYEFLGRCGGWLCLVEFNGHRLTTNYRHDCHSFDPEELTYKQLYQLYRFVVQCAHDFSQEQVMKEYEYQMAFQAQVQVFDDVLNAKEEYAAWIESFPVYRGEGEGI